MTYALINQDNLVVNVISWDGKSDWQPPEEFMAVPLQGEAGIGWSYIDGQFVPPPEEESSDPVDIATVE